MKRVVRKYERCEIEIHHNAYLLELLNPEIFREDAALRAEMIL
jgi:hypothetical protein